MKNKKNKSWLTILEWSISSCMYGLIFSAKTDNLLLQGTGPLGKTWTFVPKTHKSYYIK
jgi:hypothetical protein